MVIKRGTILKRKGSHGRWVVVRKVEAAYSDPTYSWVTMLKIRASDGVSYGQDEIGIIKTDSDQVPICYIRPDVFPATLNVWQE